MFMSHLTLDWKLIAKMSVTPCIDRDILVALGEDDGERGWGGGGMRRGNAVTEERDARGTVEKEIRCWVTKRPVGD